MTHARPSRLLPLLLLAAPFLGGAGACDCGGGTVPDAGPGKCRQDADCLAQNYCAGVGFCAPFNPDSDARGCLRALAEPCVGGTVCSDAARACVPVCGAGGADAGTCAPLCRRDTDCWNSVYCDGHERCQPGDPLADARGCRPASPLNPCVVGQLCDEANQRCVSSDSDADGDGASADYDCDDTDAARFPGNSEVCDVTGHDEDCNEATFGTKDDDGDGFLDAACCNGLRCGTDCDDRDPTVNPNAREACNGVDDDCDGLIDEGATVPLYADLDQDGFGTGPADAGCLGTPGRSTLGNDCDDTNPAINPGAVVCTGLTTQSYDLCTSAGTYVGGKCSLQLTCRVQPNGTGLCL